MIKVDRAISDAASSIVGLIELAMKATSGNLYDSNQGEMGGVGGEDKDQDQEEDKDEEEEEDKDEEEKEKEKDQDQDDEQESDHGASVARPGRRRNRVRSAHDVEPQRRRFSNQWSANGSSLNAGTSR